MTLTLEILKLIITAILPVIALILYFKYNSRIQASEAIKSVATAGVSFLYEASPNIYSAYGKKILEIDIKITNASSKKLGLPAIFIKFKPLINRDKLSTEPFKNFDSLEEFEELHEFEKNCSLLKFKNISYIKNSYWGTSINGISIRKSFDIIEMDFCKKYPIIMAQIKIYGVSTDQTGIVQFPKYKVGKLRMPWCNFLEKKYHEKYNFFDFSNEDYIDNDLKIKKGERILTNMDGSIDNANTRTFLPILQTVMGSHMEQIIKLDTND